jgi:excisionase family DNA binding protein
MPGDDRKSYSIEEEGYVTAPLLTVPEAARYLGVGRKMVYQLIERGEITAVRVDGSTRIERKSLDQFRASGRLI